MLKEKDVMKILAYDESCGHSLEEMIIFQYSKYLLNQFIGQFIVDEYKKKDPNKQQIWSSNVLKLNFIVRQILNQTEHVWLKDINGICLEKYIISPILEEIKLIMKNYIKDCYTDMSSNDVIETLGNKPTIAMKIIYEINQKELHKKILDFIAPHFQLVGI